MDKKELLKQKEMLMKEIKKEKAKLNEYEKTLSLYELKEAEKKPVEKKAAPAKKPATKKPAAKKPAAKKPAAKKPAPVANKPAPALTPIEGANKKNMKKHIIVPMAVYEKYEYEQRKKDWHKYSGMYEKQIVCDGCKDDDNFETVLLENGNNLCYYCWVKKPVKLNAKSEVKPVAVKKVESKPATLVVKKEEEVKKVETKPTTNNSKKSEGNPTLFCIISITLGVLLVALIVILALGIISNWTFMF